MEQRINTVASLILPEKSENHLIEKWWFTEGIPNGFFVNYKNTIIGIGCCNTSYKTLINPAKEVIRKVKEIEEKINLQKDGNKAKPYQVRQVRNIILKYQIRGKY